MAHLLQFILLLTLVHPAFAQSFWEPESNGPFGGGLSGFGTGVFAVHGADIYARGTRGGIYCSNDDGESWQLISTFFKAPDRHHLRHISTADNGDIFVLTNRDAYRSRDQGETWEHLISSDVWFTDVLVYGDTLFITGEKTDVAFRNMPMVTRSVDGGRSWEHMEKGLQPATFARGIVETKGILFVAAGFRGSWEGTVRVYRSKDWGESWHPVLKVDGWAPLIDVAKDGSLYFSSDEDIYVSTDNGENWSSIAGDLDNLHVAGLVIGPDHLPRILDSFSEIYRYDGANWQQLVNMDVTLVGFSITQDNTVLLATWTYGPLRLLPGNIIPTRTDIKRLEISVTQLRQDSRGTLYALASGQTFYRSRNQGDSWEPMWDGEGIVLDFEVTASDDIYTCGYWTGVSRFESSTGTWESLGLTRKPFIDIASDGYEVYVSIMEDGLWRYNESTMEWGRAGLDNSSVVELLLAGGGGLYTREESGDIYYSSDPDRQHWRSVDFGEGIARKLFLAPDNSVWILADSQIFKTSNNGNSWTVIEGPDTNLSMINFAINSQLDIFVTTNTGKSFVSHDHGDTWKVLDEAQNDIVITNFFFDSEERLYAATRYQGVLRSQASTKNRPSSLNNVRSFAVRQNFPNPFNEVTTIPFSVGADSQIRISVYNMLGEEVAVLLDDFCTAGEYRTHWNAEGFASGVYLYAMEVDGKRVAGGKLLMLR